MALENNMDPLRLYGYMRTFNSEEIANRIELDKTAMNQLTVRMEGMIKRIDADYAPLKEAFAFMLSDDPRFQQGQYFIPAKKVCDSGRLCRTGPLGGSGEIPGEQGGPGTVQPCRAGTV